MKQLNHYESLEKMPQINLDYVIYACSISSQNLGLISRSADIFGTKEIYYLENDKTINEKQFKKLSRNSNVPIFPSKGLETLLKLKHEGYSIVALEITDTSVPLRKMNFKQKVCLIIGNEQNGIPQEILDLADYSCHIEMIGNHISSLNVSIATSIALYEITQTYLKE